VIQLLESGGHDVLIGGGGAGEYLELVANKFEVLKVVDGIAVVLIVGV
jgi:hypothetical protein